MLGNEKNLIRLTTEKAREIGKLGGIASGVSKKRKKNTREITALMLESKLSGTQDKKILKKYQLDSEDMTVTALMVAGQIESATKGNTNAFNKLLELEESQKTDEVQEYQLPAVFLTKDFVDINRIIDKGLETGETTEIVFVGGRGSTKSTYWAIKTLEILTNDPKAHAVITRRYKTDLRNSVFKQMQKQIEMLGFTDNWTFTTSPMEATNKKTGQKIVFWGCDKPISLKSIAVPFGYVKVLVHEELDEMQGDDQVRSVRQSVIRGADKAIVFKAFNPPKSANNWANQYILIPKPKTIVHKSCYLNTPIEWLGQPFIDEANHIENTNPRVYKNEYLGEITGSGGSVFENIIVRSISDDEIATMGEFYHGLDFGYVHPQVFIKCHYNRDSEKLYIIDEVYAWKISNKAFAKKIESYKKYEIICDSANPDKIGDLREWDFDVVGASKGAGSLNYSMEWLQTRVEIVIDPNRTPNVCKEFTSYEYEQLGNGQFSSSYPNVNDDGIAATRYALNRVLAYNTDKWE